MLLRLAKLQAVADALDMPEVPPRMVEQLGERQFQAQLLQMIEDVSGRGQGVRLEGVDACRSGCMGRRTLSSGRLGVA